MRGVLVSWIGHADLRAAESKEPLGIGPVAQAVEERQFDHAFLIADHEDRSVNHYSRWIEDRVGRTPKVHVLREQLTSPTDFSEIYVAAVRASERALADDADNTSLTYHLSPGTPAMAAVWIILAKTRFPAELIESSRERGVVTASVPFDISADFLPDLLRRPDEELQRLSAGLPSQAPEFDTIIYRSGVMERVVLRARRVAPRSVPVLIEGETGTGKELLARAIHRASPRRTKPFVAVNCGAIPPELVESELFGHEKGAFTGAVTRRNGHFLEADGGSLFLDEVGELPKPAQVKLLRVLQEGEVLPVGSSRSRNVDVRTIAATNRPIIPEVADGTFREDLFHRLAVAILRLPPLRERGGDLPLLIDHVLSLVNREGREQPGFVEKELSVGARDLLLAHPWPGNVRELQNTLSRASIWTPDAIVKAEDIYDALLPPTKSREDGVLGKPLGDGLDLAEILGDVARHYLRRALDEVHGNKTRAAQLLGLPSYQTLTNWTKRYGVDA
ncbi:MAG: sigma-54 dependent transcriptional regulator [Gammaproteobacteria bacterium]|nr:sigma-54 dependent transcriptional regulator [Gammaproteobacteria bacterium]MDE0451284.1 sigma-54 dependent transcriptional regulator [Gammaproteobacteria bacterium]